jgi:hypothetical protein
MYCVATVILVPIAAGALAYSKKQYNDDCIDNNSNDSCDAYGFVITIPFVQFQPYL